MNNEYNIFETPIDEWNEDDMIELMKQIQELVNISIEDNYEQFFSRNFKSTTITDVQNYLKCLWDSDTTEENSFLKNIISHYSVDCSYESVYL